MENRFFQPPNLPELYTLRAPHLFYYAATQTTKTMKQQISAHLTPGEWETSAPPARIQGQVSGHPTPIDNQSQTAQASAQIVRKNIYAAITLSSGYTSHPKQKKMNVPKTWQPAFLPSRLYPVYTFYHVFYTRLYPFMPCSKIYNIRPQRISPIATKKYTLQTPMFNFIPSPPVSIASKRGTTLFQALTPYLCKNQRYAL